MLKAKHMFSVLVYVGVFLVKPSLAFCKDN